jgi:Sap, sulfolipid-1-addressing protein
VFTLGYAIGEVRATQHGNGRTIVDLIEILVGIALAGVGARQWRRRHGPRSNYGVTQGLTNRLKELRPWQAAIVGVLKQPWMLTMAAALVVVHQHHAFVVALMAFLLFTVVSTATVGATYLYYSRHPGEADARLSALRLRLTEAGPAVFALISFLVGAYLIVDGALGR